MTKIKTDSNPGRKSIYLTAKGLADAKIELGYLKGTKRTQIADRIRQAREYGDLTENSEYDIAVEDQSLIENRISQLENIVRDAKVIAGQRSQDFVVIGSTVKIEMDEGVDEFTIVGRVEADPAKKRISNESPLGLALIGARKG
ncbi:transcription elongation factor GreA, partial [Patescibacteria group bacterium]|nr:transcription elongation factor GreA [Patescibacteria group bacterium]